MSSSNPKKKARVSVSTEENLSLANQTPLERDGDDIRIYDQDKSLKRKEFWNDYNPYRDKDNKKRAECIHCHKTFAADSMTNGTTHLSRHWKACVRNPRNKIKGTQSKLKLVKVEESVPCEMESWVLNQSEAEKAFVRMVAMGELPLQLVEHYTVKRFLTSLNPEFIVPSLVSVARDCFKLFLKEKDKLGEFLESCQRVCLTTDSWISIHGEDYITLTAHFIDNDWKLQKRVLNFCYTDDTCEEFTLARVIKDCLTSWGLCDKIFSITVEDSNPNDVACVNLRQMVIENGTCISHGKNLKFMCVARIMNLIVWDVLEEYSSLVDKVRAVIMPVRNFPDRLHVFKEQARKLGVECKSSLRTDEPTKWNSIYRMLDVAVKYKDVFAELEPPVDEDGSFIEHISSEEWMRIEKLANFLKAFYDLASHVFELFSDIEYRLFPHCPCFQVIG